MKQIRKRWQRLPAWVHAVTNLLGILLSLFLIYVMIGTPAFSVQNAFRRAEKANLVGASEILAQVRTDGTPYTHLVLAADDNSVTLYAHSRRGGELVYIPKEGSFTIAAAPDSTFYPLESAAVIPVVLFDNDPRAIRAEVDLALSAEWEGVSYEKTYPLSADRTHDGCFIFTLQSSSNSILGGEGMLLQTLLQVTGNSMADTAGKTIPATVRLYDSADHLLAEETIQIRSAATKCQTP